MRFLAMAVAISLGFGQLRADNTATAWPLAKGDYWIYEGNVSWFEKNPATGQNQVYQKHLTWKSEVTDIAPEVQGVQAILFHGFPTDLAWYDSTTQPSDTLILRVGPDYYT